MNRKFSDSTNFEQMAKTIGLISNRIPDPIVSLDDNIPLHAARLLLLILLAGRPKDKPAIDGRTKLVKLDFFVRYPMFLIKAAEILLSNEKSQPIKELLKDNQTIEARMIRYRYGPWDKKYYLIISYLSCKNFIEIENIADVDRYKITPVGKEAASELVTKPEFSPLKTRCEVVSDLFGDMNGTEIKNFIYRHYPEVTRASYYQEIIP